MPDKPLVLFELLDQVARLTLNHPEKRNALSRQMLEALRDNLARLRGGTPAKVVVVRAAGAVFSSGHDLRELAGATPEAATSLFALCTDVMEAVRQLPQPVLAEVQGLATAAGCQLAMSCDLVVAADDAAFATPGVKIGLFCTTPAVPLSRALPTKKALELLLTGEPLPARDAARYGMVNRVVPRDQLEAETLRLARTIVSFSGDTVALGKQAFYRQLPLARGDAYRLAQQCMVDNLAQPDAQEGIRAFLEKRPPQWTH